MAQESSWWRAWGGEMAKWHLVEMQMDIWWCMKSGSMPRNGDWVGNRTWESSRTQVMQHFSQKKKKSLASPQTSALEVFWNNAGVVAIWRKKSFLLWWAVPDHSDYHQVTVPWGRWGTSIHSSCNKVRCGTLWLVEDKVCGHDPKLMVMFLKNMFYYEFVS